MTDLLFLGLGLAAGIGGTLIGAGGGFLLSPILLFLYPEMSPARLTALSLLAVACNSVSGSLGYAVRKQVHWPSVALFTIVALPGTWLGVKLSGLIAREHFELVFAAFLFVMGVFVFYRSFRQKNKPEKDFWNRRNQVIGSVVSFFVGVIAALLGLGGGIIHVPLLSEFLGYPVHLAAGTSHAMLAFTSVFAVISHFLHGDLDNLESWVPWMVVGLVVGAQVGTALSKKVKSVWILRGLGMALLSVSLRLLYRHFA